MTKYNYITLKVLALASILFVLSCDEDYVNSLSTEQPIVYLETNDNLDSLYLVSRYTIGCSVLKELT
jgi:hypothetical protein